MMGVGMIGIQLHGSLQIRDSLIRVAQIMASSSEKIERVDIGRVGLQNLPAKLLGMPQLTAAVILLGLGKSFSDAGHVRGSSSLDESRSAS